MDIIPAIDLINGQAVRLYQGDYNRKTVYSSNPVQVAQAFAKQGVSRLHVVDLEGAKEGKIVNTNIIKDICQAVSIPVEVGGGIRDIATVDTLLHNGADRVILGTAALQDKVFLKQALQEYGHHKILVSIDAKDGKVASCGWLNTSDVYAIDLAKEMYEMGVKYIVYTDISRDGTLTEPNYPSIKQMIDIFKGHVIASGGMATLFQLIKLKEMGAQGVIIGKAAYTGQINLNDAVRFVNEFID